MEQKIIMLGTGHAMVTKCYNTCFLLQNGEEQVLVDAGGGNGILTQMERAGADWRDIHQIFLTHGHTDHILGAVWAVRKLVSLMKDGQYQGECTIYCHDQAADMLRTFCELTLIPKLRRYIGERLFIEEVCDGSKRTLGGLPFTFFDIHSGKTKQFGFRAELSLEQSLVCLGDEPYHESCAPYVKGCRWLMSEAFCLYAHREIFSPYEKSHSTVKEAAELAQSLGAAHLILYHTEDKNLSRRKQLYTEEAGSFFQGQIHVPEDLEVIDLK